MKLIIPITLFLVISCTENSQVSGVYLSKDYSEEYGGTLYLLDKGNDSTLMSLCLVQNLKLGSVQGTIRFAGDTAIYTDPNCKDYKIKFINYVDSIEVIEYSSNCFPEYFGNGVRAYGTFYRSNKRPSKEKLLFDPCS